MQNNRIREPDMSVLPNAVLEALTRLNARGYEAYLVGGCVRDLWMGRTPQDYDLTTSALPEETEAVFSECRVVETGIRHGTVTVLIGGMALEITTFRTDGVYSDGRHPDGVSFTRSLTEDLQRRDFTVNAIAWSPDSGWRDPFGGREDIGKGILRCVGDPAARFSEDALRILRLVRFSSTLGFDADPETERAALELRHRLNLVSAERIYAELTKLLCGPYAERALMRYHPVLGTVIPDLTPCVGFPQITPYHQYDVYTHTCKVVSGVRPDPVLRWAALLHDVAKPECHAFYDGKSHFHGHPEQGALMAKCILRDLRAERKTADTVVRLIQFHDRLIPPERKAILRLLTDLPGEEALLLTDLMEADCEAKAEAGKRVIPEIRELRNEIRSVLDGHPCLHVTDLHIRGKDLQDIGYLPGQAMGDCLKKLLQDVQDGTVPNETEALLRRASELRNDLNDRPEDRPQ